MNNETAVTVCIPTYDDEPTLPLVLEGLDEQTVQPREIIVIDGGSTDRTLEIAENHGVRILEQPEGGLATARNIGLQNCSFQIGAMLDADAVPSKRWLEVALDVLEEYDASTVGVEIIERGTSPSARWRARRMPFNSRGDTGPIDRIPGNNMVFRTETFLHIDGWDESYQFANEDVDLCRRLNEAGYEMIYTPQTSVDHWGTTGIDVVSHLWRWHSPDGGAATYPEFFSRVVEHCGKATKYAFEDALDGHFSGLPFDLAIVPIHIWRDWKQLH